jgi:hypothetical protein
VATVALWHLGVTAVLAGLLSSVMLLQSFRSVLHRQRRRGAQRAVAAPAPPRTVASSSGRDERDPGEPVPPLMTSAGGS